MLVGKLSDLVGITTQANDANGLTILVGGSSLVRDNEARQLQVDDTTATVAVRWDEDGNQSTVTDGQRVLLNGGDAGGQVDVINNIVPKFQAMLNTFVTSLKTTVNTQHQAGQDLNGTAGIAFFTGTNASDISINATVAADTSLVAASKSGGAALDSDNASAMANLASLVNGPDSSYRQLVNVLGLDAQRVNSQAKIQQNITNSVDGSVQSVQGVNLDEEMTNLVQYQRAYESAAKYLNIVNSTLDSLMSILR